MGCNCGKRGAAAVKYEFTAPSGKSTTYNTEVEAKAAQIRAGGGTIKTV